MSYSDHIILVYISVSYIGIRNL